MFEGQSLYSGWADLLLGASVQGALGIVAALIVASLFPRLSGAARSWLWRLAFARVLIGLFWAAPMPLPFEVTRAPEAPVSAPANSPSTDIPVTVHSGEPLSSPPAAGPGLAEVFAGCWLLGAGWCLFRTARQIRAAGRLRAYARPVADERILSAWYAMLAAFELRQSPELRESESVQSPLLVQVRRPAVIIPTGLADAWSGDQIRLMFAHELAHLRRRDLLWGWLPAAVHALFFFHPLVWLGNREWRLAHDMAADELALATSGASAAEYARMLVRLAVFPRSPAAGLALMDARETARTLERRLKAMSRLSTDPRRRWMRWLPAVLLSAAVLMPVRVTAFAAPPAPENPPVTAPADPAATPPAAPAATPAADPTAVPAADPMAAPADTLPSPDPAPRSRNGRVAPDPHTSRDVSADPAAASRVAATRSRRGGGKAADDEGRIRILEDRLRTIERQLDALIEQNSRLSSVQRDLETELRRARRGVEERELDIRRTYIPRNGSAAEMDGNRLRDRRDTPPNYVPRDEQRAPGSDYNRSRDRVDPSPARRSPEDPFRRSTPAPGRDPDFNRSGAAANARQFMATVRVLKQDDGSDRVLSVAKLMLLNGEWATVEWPTGRQLPTDQKDPRTSALDLRVLSDNGGGAMLESYWTGDAGKQGSAIRWGRATRLQADLGSARSRSGVSHVEITVEPVERPRR
ncbi:MAG: hypothetical protein K0Q72_4998 [Armatimonadetes bacterium]|nr:hypothetical protein [Armatimonadota bacterium]